MTPLVLASASPSRAALLRNAGVDFTVMVSDVDEAPIKAALLAAGASPAEVAEALAERKSRSVSSHCDALVIGADQTLELGGRLYDKTATAAETRNRLVALRGRTHRLHTASAIARDGEILWRDCQTSVLTMRDFSDAFLDRYMADHGGAVASSVGAYHLEGFGAQLFEAIDGDYFAILGLPLVEVLAALRTLGAMPS